MFSRYISLISLLGVLFLLVPSVSNAALDFTAVTAAVDASTIVTAIGAIAAIKILPGVAKWGYNKVINWFR